MRMSCWLICSLLMMGCASHGVRCAGRLLPINVPAARVAAPDAHSAVGAARKGAP